MKKALRQKMIPSVTALVEYYDNVFEVPDNLREEYEENPQKILRAFLERQGMKVKAVGVIRRRRGEVRRGGYIIRGWYHFCYPPSWASRWIYIER